MFLGLNPFASARRRLGAIFAAVAVSVVCLACGAVMAFILAPGQAIRAYRIARLPVMGAADVEAASAGDTILVTGILADNAPRLDGFDFVVYEEEVWRVTTPDRDDGEAADPYGSWEAGETVAPALTLRVGDRPVRIHRAGNVRLGGALREEIVEGGGSDRAKYGERWLPDGSRRYRGVSDGDLLTVLGKKATTGGVIPEELFAGDRVAFEDSQRQAASGLLFGGILLMILSPVVLVGGLWGAIFGRRR
ncbi:hypothetical protein D6833_13080 [Candidatus Parcubacteria bacterium]|nr:MAG: hypothetical protein D6833_13080 [Candidatus Parcubacteria bacterium]